MPFLPSSGSRRMSNVHGSASNLPPAGTLLHKDAAGEIIGSQKIYANQEIIVGRDKTLCQYVLHDLYASKRHLRLYTVVYENDEPNEVDTLVYAEDLSRNGTYWNGGLIGQGNGGFLLSEGDVLRLTRHTSLVFTGMPNLQDKFAFDLTQECEMAQFRNEYVITDRLLGAGAFGQVFMAIEQKARVQVACKMVDLRKLMPRRVNRFGHPEQPATAEDVDPRVQMRKLKDWVNERKRERGFEEKLKLYLREVEILASINHPNIIGIEKVFITDNTLYMMQNLVTAGDLFSYIESKNGKLLEAEAAVIIRQILIALSFLHERNIVHRDIKPDNILMTSLSAGCRIVLTDFGAARRIEGHRHQMSTQIGTHEYAAPEMLFSSDIQGNDGNRGYTRAVDMWALGCVAVVLLTGGLAFCDPVTNCYSEKLSKECNLVFLQKSADWQRLRIRPRAFVENLLVLDEDARMTAKEALNHTWFSNQIHKTDFEELYQRTIKSWRPKSPKAPIVEFMDHGSIKYLSCAQGYLESVSTKVPRKSGLTPVDEPYKPFPRAMHLALWPKRDVKERLSDEVLSAIENKWPATSEPTLVWKARMNHVPNGRQLSWSCIEPTRRLRRETEPIKAQKEVILSRPTLRSSRVLPLIPFRMRANEERTSGLSKNTGLGATTSGSLEESGALMPDTSRARENKEGPHRDFAERSPKSSWREGDSLQVNGRSGSRLQPQSKVKNSIEVNIEPSEVGESLNVRSDVNTLLPVGAFGPSYATARQGIRGSLKRKAPKPNLRLGIKRIRRPGSIYDLSDDSDGDGDDIEASKQISSASECLAKTVYTSQPASKTLYLPR